MTALRLLGNKWMLVLGAVAVLGLAAGQTYADHPEGGYYRSSPGWYGGWSGGYGHREMPFRGERFDRDRFGGFDGFRHFRPPVLVSPPVYGPRWGEGYSRPVYGGCVVSGGPRIVIIIR